jgi:hypothetical protein
MGYTHVLTIQASSVALQVLEQTNHEWRTRLTDPRY